MSLYTVSAPPPEVEEEVLEKAPEARPAPARQAAAQERAWLTESLLEMSPTRPQRRTLDFFLSMFVHTLLLGVLLLIPLYFTEAIDLSQFTRTFLVAPPPPPPPPPPPSPSVVKVAAKAPRRVFTVAGKLVAPVAIPQKVAMIKEDQLPPDIGGGVGVVGGVPGGVPGGQIGGVLGGIITGAQRSAIPEAPSAAPKAPIRVGGRVKMPRALYSPDPMYPPLARQARIQGDVQIDAVIDPAGNVVEMQVLSGHPLLIPAALEALRKWKYQPSYLNEEPVSVQLVVTIRFRLN